MLRINLLPAYIAERRKTRLTIAAFSAAFLAVTGGLLAYYFVKEAQVQDLEAKASAEETAAQAVQAIQAQAQTTRSGVQPILDKVSYVDQVRFYNTLRPRIYRQVAAYTHKDIQYNSMAVTGRSLAVSAFAKNLSDIGRFLITMFGNPDLTAVSVSGPPGWPAGQAGGGGGAAGGYPGGGGGYPGGGLEGPGAGGFEGPPAGGFPGGDMPGGGYPGGGGFPGAGGVTAQQPPRRGYPFTITGVLVQPVTPPAPPAIGRPGGGGGFGGPGGMGGYPGMGGPPDSLEGPGGAGPPPGA